MIIVSGLTRKLPEGKQILYPIDAMLVPGTFVAVVGASGSGKSTLLRCLALKEPWESGSYKVDNKDIRKSGLFALMRYKRQVAYLEQKAVLLEKRKAYKNVLIGAVGQTPWWRRMTGMVRNDDYMGAMDMLEKVGLLDKAQRVVEKMSGGERQRVAIARALVHGAKLLLADEPVSGLDPHSAEEIMGMLKSLCREQGTTVVAALHRVELAEKFADEIWGMEDGRIVVTARGRRLTSAEKIKLS